MNFLLSEEQIQFRDLLRDFFYERFSGEKIKKFLFENRTDLVRSELESIWTEFSNLGALSGGVPESIGGLGLGFLNHILLVSEAARVLAPLPVLETLCFGILPLENILSNSAESNRDALLKSLESLISGQSVAAGFIDKNIISEVGEILYFENEDSFCICLLDSQSLKLNISPGAELIRGSRILETIENEETLGAIFNLRELELSRLVLIAAELIAVARAAEEATIEFVKTRKQFGVAIETFQAIQHKLADIRVKLDSAESLLHFAGWAKDNSPDQFTESALSCILHARQISKSIVEECLQLHGGMGFTWECNIHLYLRRVLSTSLWFGDTNKLAIELAELENPSAVGYQ